MAYMWENINKLHKTTILSKLKKLKYNPTRKYKSDGK